MKYHKGFTLIELLVVISIIGMLASVILVSLNNARARGKDANVRQEAIQLKNLFELQKTSSYSPTYANLTGGQAISGTGFSGYRFGGSTPCSSSDSQFQQICSAMTAANGGAVSVFIGTTDTDASSHQMNSIVVQLPSSSPTSPLYFCVGSGGINSDNVSDPFNTNLSKPGCFGNPGGPSGGTSGNIVTAFGFSPGSIPPNGTATTNLNITLSQAASCSFTVTNQTGSLGDNLELSGINGPIGSGASSFSIGPFTQSGSATIGVSCSGGGTGSAFLEVTN